MALTAKKRLFCHEYILDLNGTQAAIRAGFAKSRAAVTASELLKEPEVIALIDELKSARAARLQADSDQVLSDLMEYRSADLREIYNENGAIKPIHEWPRFFSSLGVVSIESFEEYEGRGDKRELVGYVRKVKWENKTKVLELIGKHVAVNAFREKVEHDVSDPLKALYEQVAGNGLRPADTPGLTGNVAPGLQHAGAFRPRED